MSINAPKIGEVFEFQDFDEKPTQMVIVDTSETHIEYRIEGHRHIETISEGEISQWRPPKH